MSEQSSAKVGNGSDAAASTEAKLADGEILMKYVNTVLCNRVGRLNTLRKVKELLLRKNPTLGERFSTDSFAYTLAKFMNEFCHAHRFANLQIKEVLEQSISSIFFQPPGEMDYLGAVGYACYPELKLVKDLSTDSNPELQAFTASILNDRLDPVITTMVLDRDKDGKNDVSEKITLTRAHKLACMTLKSFYEKVNKDSTKLQVALELFHTVDWRDRARDWSVAGKEAPALPTCNIVSDKATTIQNLNLTPKASKRIHADEQKIRATKMVPACFFDIVYCLTFNLEVWERMKTQLVDHPAELEILLLPNGVVAVFFSTFLQYVHEILNASVIINPTIALAKDNWSSACATDVEDVVWPAEDDIINTTCMTHTVTVNVNN